MQNLGNFLNIQSCGLYRFCDLGVKVNFSWPADRFWQMSDRPLSFWYPVHKISATHYKCAKWSKYASVGYKFAKWAEQQDMESVWSEKCPTICQWKPAFFTRYLNVSQKSIINLVILNSPPHDDNHQLQLQLMLDWLSWRTSLTQRQSVPDFGFLLLLLYLAWSDQNPHFYKYHFEMAVEVDQWDCRM